MVSNNKIGRRKSKMEILAGKQVVANFILSTEKELISLRDSVERREGSSGQGYFLSVYGVQLPLKYSKVKGYEHLVTVTVPKGSRIEDQLKEKGFLK
jgi:hypothetical protein